MLENNKRISIIIPMYKVEAFIERCLMSCIHQDIDQSDYEIVVVNDGSPDRSLEIATFIASKHTNIHVFNQENQGLSSARNTGFKKAKGEYVWFVDSDDWIKEDCLQMITQLCKNRNLDILQICAADVCNNNIVRRFSYADEKNVFSGIKALVRGIPFCAPFSIYKREFLIKYNLEFYPGIFHEDNEFSPRAYSFAERVSSLNDLFYFVFQNPNSITRTVNPKKAFDCIIVLNSLHAFMKSKNMSKKESVAFHRLITGTFNAALYDTIGISQAERKRFNDELFANKHLYKHLIKSRKIIYQIEGLLMRLFPHSPIRIYQLLNMIDKRKIKRNH